MKKKKNLFFFSKSQAVLLLFVSYLPRTFLASSLSLFRLTAKNQQTSFLEEIYFFTLELLKTACFIFFPSPSGD